MSFNGYCLVKRFIKNKYRMFREIKQKFIFMLTNFVFLIGDFSVWAMAKFKQLRNFNISFLALVSGWNNIANNNYT
jgi:hypothetical protein